MIYRSSTDSTYESWSNLSNDIILKAVEDYRHILRKLRKQSDDTWLLQQKKELEQFFLSSWFQVLTTLDGGQLLRDLKSETRLTEVQK